MVGTPELVVILVVALMLFGPQKLPELAKALGQAVGEYNKAKRGIEEEFNKAKSEVEKEAGEVNKMVLADESRRNSAEIRKIARGMGIQIEGKDDAALLREIDERVKKKQAATQAPAQAKQTPPASSAQGVQTDTSKGTS